MVQAGVNPFPGNPGFTTAAALNANDGNIPVAVAVKNDSLGASLKPESSVSITPSSISVAQVNIKVEYSIYFVMPMIDVSRILLILFSVISCAGISTGNKSVQFSVGNTSEPIFRSVIVATSAAWYQCEHCQCNRKISGK